jgi:phosphopantothenoylcysteine decarboxylase/phosphopantothenate--cysteine ligase
VRKGADWILANDVSGDVMGGASNHLHLVTGDGAEDLGSAAKEALARTLVERIATELKAS